MTTVKIYGKLAKALGQSEWNLNVNSVAEALFAINSQTGEGVKKFFFDKINAAGRYQVIIDGEDLELSGDLAAEELRLQKEGINSIEIIPMLQGSFLGIIGVVLGIGGLLTATTGMAAIMSVMLIATGISNLLAEPPELPEQRQITNPSSDPQQLANSYLFNGPVNIINEGGPVPIGYGRLIVGSQTIMSAYDVRKVLVREAGRVR